jgi:5,10-methylenetetrahydrofolate reductase
MQLMETGLFNGFTRLHVAGHPEGNRDIDPDGSDRAVMEALRWKQAFADRSDAAMAIVTQFAFEAQPVIDWANRLQAEGIMSDAHASFLVFQGYVSELAVKSPQELTELLEQISGSAQHKDEYERLEREKTKAENQASYAFQKKKLLVQERTNVAKQKKEAEEYAALQKGLKETRRKLELLRLFHLEKEVTERKQLAEEEAKEAEEVAAKQEEIDEPPVHTNLLLITM